jgi:hypothetical protein
MVCSVECGPSGPCPKRFQAQRATPADSHTPLPLPTTPWAQRQGERHVLDRVVQLPASGQIRTFVHVDDSHQRADNLFIMRTALAHKPEYDEVPVSSTEVLESNVAAMRGELTELKTDFRQHRTEFQSAVTRLHNDIKAVALRLDSDIKAAVSELRAEIRATAAKAASDLKDFASRVETQLHEMRADYVGLRNKVYMNHETLIAKIDRNFETLSTKIDKKTA